MPFPDVLILRHGETEWNSENRMQGGLNSPLTEKGRAQALRQGELLQQFGIEGFAALSSPQGRAFQTASLALATQVDFIRTDDRLREIGVGDWQGMKRDDLATDLIDTGGEDGPLSYYEHAPNGEGYAALHARCTSFIADLTGPSILVTHGITSRMLRVILLGHEMSSLGDLPGGQGCIYHIKNSTQNRLG